MQTVSPAVPVRIVVDVTRRCNLTCYYCHSASGPSYRGPAIAGTRVQDILQTAEQSGVFEVTVSGGEPLMWDGLPELAKASQALEFTSLQLITNATLITDRVLKTLSLTALRRICVSLDGPEDVHDAVRGRGRFAKTMQGIACLRQIVNNVTVISVLDRRNYHRWPELTEQLISAGVKQHHLTPVCFAGHAMEKYDDTSLRDRDYQEIVRRMEDLVPHLPADFIISFKDGLLRPVSERSFTLSGFTCEYFKGHHIVIQPDGKVQRAARAWGRTWRADECIGNINDASLHQILLNESATVVPFEFREEMQRKYHIMEATPETLNSDLADVSSVKAGQRGNLAEPGEIARARIHPAALLDSIPLPRFPALRDEAARNPGRYRLRNIEDAALLFDTETFEIHVLSPYEAEAMDLRATV